MKVYIGPYTNWVGPYQLAEYFEHLNVVISAAQYITNGVFWLIAPFMSPAFAVIVIQTNEWFESKKFVWRDDRLHALGEFFAHGFAKKLEEDEKFLRDNRPKTWLYKLCEWIHDKKTRKIKIKLDPWDTWNMDTTLSMIILPMLKQLKETKHGSGYVDLEDVPEELRYSETEDYDSQLCFEFYHSDDVKKKECDIHTRYEWLLDELIWTFEQVQPDYDWEDQYSSGDIEFMFEPCEDTPSLSRMVRGPNDTYKMDYAARDAHAARIQNGYRLFGKYLQTLWD